MPPDATRRFQLWAPLPKRVQLQLDGQLLPMIPGANGEWTADLQAPNANADYGFVLDGQGPFPDPRSPLQPNGVHGLSRLIDHDAFRWTDSGWEAPPLSSAVIYELHIGTFTPQGTFLAAIEKLDHLVQLGITHVELMPVNEFDGMRGWGYDGVDLFAPHHAYGSPDDLKQLVDACHRRRLAVLLDVVYNHLGPSGNYLAKFAPYFSTKFSSPWGPGINFDDQDSDQVRRFFCDNALMWLRDYHFDGLRLDAVHAIFDASARPFLEQLAEEVQQLETELARPLVLIPESDLNDPRLLCAPESGGFGLHAQWSDDFHHALHAVLTGERFGYFADFGSLADLAKAMRNAFVQDGCYSIFRRRHHGRPPRELGGRRFLGYLQNHDQVGNRALGERSSKLMSVARSKIGAALVLTSPFIPMLFQGEEWDASTPFLYFTDHADPVLARAVREGRRREFIALGCPAGEFSDPQAPDTFLRSKLNWSELAEFPHGQMLEWRRQLIRLRRSEAALADDRLDRIQTRHDEQNRWLTIQRGGMCICCNFNNRPEQAPLPRSEGGYRLLLASSDEITIRQDHLTLPPDSVAIVKSR